VPHSLLVFTRAQDYTAEMFEISDDEYDFEILRRSPTDTYYLEKIQVFEETFGINKLQGMVQNICTKVAARVAESEDGSAISGQFLRDEEMRMMLAVHEDFLTRHTTIKNSINDTYRIGNQLLDYVEKQMIIDYHLRGDQKKLEKDFPEIAKKAKKFIGYESYFDMSVTQISGVPMSPNDPHYSTLMEKQAKIIDKITRDYERHESGRQAVGRTDKQKKEKHVVETGASKEGKR